MSILPTGVCAFCRAPPGANLTECQYEAWDVERGGHVVRFLVCDAISCRRQAIDLISDAKQALEEQRRRHSRPPDPHAARPECCGQPMRTTGMGAHPHPAWICGSCERYQGPHGARTPQQWWRPVDRGRAWEWAQGAVYATPSGAHEEQPVRPDAPHPDPLDVEIDGRKLRDLLYWDGRMQQETSMAHGFPRFTPAQRAAVSAHWSAQLRAKVAAAAAVERDRVVVDLPDGDE